MSTETVVQKNIRFMRQQGEHTFNDIIAKERQTAADFAVTILFEYTDDGKIIQFWRAAGNPISPVTANTANYIYRHYPTSPPKILDIRPLQPRTIAEPALTVLQTTRKQYNLLAPTFYEPTPGYQSTLTSREEIIPHNLKKMLGKDKGEMWSLMESHGGNAGTVNGIPTAGYSFYYTARGEIILFYTGHLSDLPPSIKKNYTALFHYQASDPPCILDVVPDYGTIPAEARSVLNECIEQFNVIHARQFIANKEKKNPSDILQFLKRLKFW